MEQPKQLLTIKQLLKKHPHLSMGGVRWMIVHRKKNGLDESACLFKPTGKVLIDEERFIAWLRGAKM